MTGLVHPEVIEGRRVWRDGSFEDILDRLHRGDPTKGWEGDPKLEVYYTPETRTWELWRLEDDGEYRMTCRSAPGVPFDERLIERLVEHDRQRMTRSLHDTIAAKNEALERDKQRRNDDYINEEVNPRMNWALKKDGLL